MTIFYCGNLEAEKGSKELWRVHAHPFLPVRENSIHPWNAVEVWQKNHNQKNHLGPGSNIVWNLFVFERWNTKASRNLPLRRIFFFSGPSRSRCGSGRVCWWSKCWGHTSWCRPGRNWGYHPGWTWGLGNTWPANHIRNEHPFHQLFWWVSTKFWPIPIYGMGITSLVSWHPTGPLFKRRGKIRSDLPLSWPTTSNNYFLVLSTVSIIIHKDKWTMNIRIP